MKILSDKQREFLKWLNRLQDTGEYNHGYRSFIDRVLLDGCYSDEIFGPENPFKTDTEILNELRERYINEPKKYR